MVITMSEISALDGWIMDKVKIRMLQDVLRQRKSIVKDSKLWREICDEVNVGKLKGKKINFTFDDLSLLESYGDNIYGSPIIAINLDAKDRLESSEDTSEDKWSQRGVFEALLPMARGQRLPLPVKDDSSFITPSGVVVSLSADKIDAAKIESLLIIENGTLMTHWNELIPLLPKEYQSSLIVYRGHGQNQNMLRELIGDLSDDIPVGVFYDFDGAGYDMALNLAETRNISILHPSKWNEIHKLPNEVLKKLNKQGSFLDQAEQLTKRINSTSTPKAIMDMLIYLREHRIAITQEHLIKHKFLLSETDNIRIIK
jgi:hypothetical protein